jgi:hypothetical protein
MRIAMVHVYGRAPSEIFKRSAALPPPTLRKDVVNTIIAFGGAFNPPHVGHKLLLTHTFFRSSFPNAVAAIIIPDTMANVARKLRRLGEPEHLALKVSECAMLWHDDLLAPWIYVDQNEGTPFNLFEDFLKREALKDGFRLQFVPLLGVNHLEEFPYYQNVGEFHQNTIYCDSLKPLACQTVSGAPMQLLGYGLWEKISSHERLLQRIDAGELSAMTALKLLYPPQAAIAEREEHALIVLKVFLQERGSSWLCRNNRDLFNNTIRLVPSRSALHAQGMPDLSSTLIREIMRTVPDGQELKNRAIVSLRDKALNPAMLLTMLRRNV